MDVSINAPTKEMKTMKGKIVTSLIALLMVGLGITSATKATDANNEFEFYNGIAENLDLTAEILENRSADGKIIIERVIGIVIDDDGNGEVMNPKNPDYNYISYRYTNGAKKGDIILSYMLYNPDNNFVDDILERFDYIIDRTE